MITMLIPISNGSPKRGAHSHVCSRISDLAHRSQTIDRLATSAAFCAELIDRRARKQFRRNGGQLSSAKPSVCLHIGFGTLFGGCRKEPRGAYLSICLIALQHNAPLFLKTCHEAAAREYVPHEQRQRIRFRLSSKGRQDARPERAAPVVH